MSFRASEPKISLATGKDLSSASNPKVRFKKPDGTTTGEWVGAISGNSVEYQTTDGDLDQAGEWWFQAVVDFGSSTQIGKIARVKIEEPIKITA